MTARTWFVLALLPCAPAWALKDGDTVYVRARNTKWLAKPDAGAPVKRTLRAGDALTWRRAAAGNFHEVQPGAEKKTGFVYFANLALQPLRDERRETARTRVDTEAFVSSGAAIRGLTQGATQLAATDAALGEAATSLRALAALQAGVTDDEFDAQLRRAAGGDRP